MNEPAPVVVADEIHAHRKWKLHLENISAFETAAMEPLVALRNALGVAAPIALGVALGKPIAGVAVGVGALQVCYSDNPGPYRQRARRMLAASLLCSLAVVAGGLAVRNPILNGFVIVLCAFVVGLVVCLGETVENLGAISLVTLVIYAVQPLTARQALLSGLLALGGGLLQTTLALLLWPIHRYTPERRQLSALYLDLSKAAITPSASDSPPVSEPMTQARKSLAALSGDDSLQAEKYWSLLNQAERIRLTLLALRRLRKRLAREIEVQIAFQLLDEHLALAGGILAAVSQSISNRAGVSGSNALLARLETLNEQLRQEQTKQLTPFLGALEGDARFQMDALTGQLHAAMRSATESAPGELEAYAKQDARRPWQSRFMGNLAKLVANLTLRSPAFRHAIRLTLCLVLGEAAAHALHHPRSYWLAMTTVIVLKQEFATTFSRSVLRILGTIGGLIVASVLFHVLPPGIGLEVLLVGVSVFVLRWAGAANYGVFSIAMSALVVFMFAITGVPPVKLIFARGEMTLLGGAIALATYMVWPTWERTQAPEVFAQMLEAYRNYFGALARARLEGRTAGEGDAGPLRMAARLARSNIEASYERLRAEPGTSTDEISLIAAMLANSHRFVRATMAIEVVSPESVPARPEFRQFASDVEKILDALVQALRDESSALQSLPDLREDHHRIVNSAESDVARYALINEETDRMTNSLNTLAEQVAYWMKLRSDAYVHQRSSAESPHPRRD